MPVLTGGNIIQGGNVLIETHPQIIWVEGTPTDSNVSSGYYTPLDGALAGDINTGAVYERDRTTHLWTKRTQGHAPVITTPGVAPSLTLLSSLNLAASKLTLPAGAGTLSGPDDVNLKYLKLGTSIPSAVSSNPGVKVILVNHSVLTPVQPWLINADGTLLGAATSTISGSAPTFPGSTSFTVTAPVGIDFDTYGGKLWINGVGFMTYDAYDATTHAFTGIDTRFSGAPTVGTKVLQIRLGILEPGNTGTRAGATSEGVKNQTIPGTPTAGLKIAFQQLVTVEAGGCDVGALAWMV